MSDVYGEDFEPMSCGKAITGATRAADGIRAVLVNRYQVEV